MYNGYDHNDREASSIEADPCHTNYIGTDCESIVIFALPPELYLRASYALYQVPFEVQ